MKKLVTAHDLTFEPFISSSDIAEKITELGKKITEKYKGKRPLFLGILNGSFVFIADLVRACDLECEIAFITLSSYKGVKSTGKIETIYGFEINLENRHVIVVEDIVDSGRTLNYFMETLTEKKPASVELASLLLKPDALQFPIKIDYLGFEISDKFVVGYGLDYDGLCRNLKGIYQLKETP